MCIGQHEVCNGNARPLTHANGCPLVQAKPAALPMELYNSGSNGGGSVQAHDCLTSGDGGAIVCETGQYGCSGSGVDSPA